MTNGQISKRLLDIIYDYEKRVEETTGDTKIEATVDLQALKLAEGIIGNLD